MLKKGFVKPMLAFDTVEAVQQELGSAGYIASDGLAVSLFLALAKQRALFLEGEAGAVLQAQVVDFVQTLRGQQLFKSPGVAETIDWAQALVELNCVALDPQIVDTTMGVLLKYQDDIGRIQGSEAARILSEVQAALVQGELSRA